MYKQNKRFNSKSKDYRRDNTQGELITVHMMMDIKKDNHFFYVKDR